MFEEVKKCEDLKEFSQTPLGDVLKDVSTEVKFQRKTFEMLESLGIKTIQNFLDFPEYKFRMYRGLGIKNHIKINSIIRSVLTTIPNASIEFVGPETLSQFLERALPVRAYRAFMNVCHGRHHDFSHDDGHSLYPHNIQLWCIWIYSDASLDQLSGIRGLSKKTAPVLFSVLQSLFKDIQL